MITSYGVITDAHLEVVERILVARGYKVPRLNTGIYETPEFSAELSSADTRDSSLIHQGPHGEMILYKDRLNGEPEFIDNPSLHLVLDPALQKDALIRGNLLEELATEVKGIRDSLRKANQRAHAYELRDSSTERREDYEMRTLK